MRISELSRRSAVSVPTIKYYLRERLLAPGTPTAANQADYSDAHLRRLRLIRALIDVGKLPVARARDVLAAVDAGDVPPHRLLGVAHAAVSRQTAYDPADPTWRSAQAEVDDLVRRRGWNVVAGSPGLAQAADAIRALRTLGQEDVLDRCLDVYADAAETVASCELGRVVARPDPEGMVEAVVTGTVLGETLLTALRLLAQQDASARRLAGLRPSATPGEPETPHRP